MSDCAPHAWSKILKYMIAHKDVFTFHNAPSWIIEESCDIGTTEDGAELLEDMKLDQDHE